MHQNTSQFVLTGKKLCTKLHTNICVFMGGVVGRGVYNLEGESEDNIYFLLSEYLYF